jgi:hypothetical protein
MWRHSIFLDKSVRLKMLGTGTNPNRNPRGMAGSNKSPEWENQPVPLYFEGKAPTLSNISVG